LIGCRPNRLLVFFQRFYDMLVIKRVVMPVHFSLMDYWINISRVGSFVTNFILAEKKKPWETDTSLPCEAFAKHGRQTTDDGHQTGEDKERTTDGDQKSVG
jgi:hypothetical protein